MIQKRKKEKYRAEELAKVVLKRLQDQASAPACDSARLADRRRNASTTLTR